MRWTLLAMIALTIGASGATVGTAASPSDPPRIVPWHVIGNAWLWSSYERVTYVYGSAGYDSKKGAVVGRYRVTGGTLEVTFDGGSSPRRAVAIWTNSPRYRTSAGFAVGSRIPLRKCSKGIGYCWQGFHYEPGDMVWWKVLKQGTRSVVVTLPVSHGRVTSVGLADTAWYRRTM